MVSFGAKFGARSAARPGVALALALGCALGALGCSGEDPRPTPEPTQPAPAPEPAPEAEQETQAPEPDPAPEFDRSAHSIDDPNSIWVVSNKRRPLNPIDFAPSDLSMPVGVDNEFSHPLREPAARAIEQLVAAAAAEGHYLYINSGYRDYGLQVGLYNRYAERDGAEAADRYSARPGHSEHQTGLALDLDDGAGCYLLACFGETPAGLWLTAHAPEFGFVLRYPEGYEEVTGFMYEPWHFRYVGPDLAAEMRDTGVATLEEFFGLEAAPGYLQ